MQDSLMLMVDILLSYVFSTNLVIKSVKGVEKVGVSGQSFNLNGTSPRANIQVNRLNRAAGYKKYWAEVKIANVSGRTAILNWEKDMADILKSEGQPMSLHKLP